MCTGQADRRTERRDVAGRSQQRGGAGGVAGKAERRGMGADHDRIPGLQFRRLLRRTHSLSHVDGGQAVGGLVFVAGMNAGSFQHSS